LDSNWLTVARLTKVRGNRGELLAESLVNDLDEAIGDRPVDLFQPSGEPAGSFAVEEIWEHKGRQVVKLVGIDSISGAEALQGLEIRIPKTERPAAPDDEFYHDDLVGCRVVDAESGKEFGVVAAWRDFGGGGVLELDGGLMVPFARSICVEIDVVAKLIRVKLPDGLLDLN
jgi:16S rRNA processing protein RimM